MSAAWRLRGSSPVFVPWKAPPTPQQFAAYATGQYNPHGPARRLREECAYLRERCAALEETNARLLAEIAILRGRIEVFTSAQAYAAPASAGTTEKGTM